MSGAVSQTLEVTTTVPKWRTAFNSVIRQLRKLCGEKYVMWIGGRACFGESIRRACFGRAVSLPLQPPNPLLLLCSDLVGALRDPKCRLTLESLFTS
ncbi:hypothetical protein CEXT_298381 [Caerostris extrusa]|uniref:Uncharacterized protein n=1 Tax=Caerostris extrusa TaxID=172846 RepID=A0AAV4T1T6_CAEEX|nr:hypothetical protein CEXT_298381 [Caerostris extrusa]